MPSALRRRQLLWPLLTSRSVPPRRPFSHKARSPRVRTHSFTARPPDLRRLTFDHKSFAEFGPLALIGTALYPVLVHRPAASLHASSPRSVALPQLRFTSLAVVSLREDFHLLECARAGRTKKRGRKIRPRGALRGCGDQPRLVPAVAAAAVCVTTWPSMTGRRWPGRSSRRMVCSWPW